MWPNRVDCTHFIVCMTCGLLVFPPPPSPPASFPPVGVGVSILGLCMCHKRREKGITLPAPGELPGGPLWNSINLISI